MSEKCYPNDTLIPQILLLSPSRGHLNPLHVTDPFLYPLISEDIEKDHWYEMG